MSTGELETLIALLAPRKPKTMVELGVNQGRTAKAILREIPSIDLYVGVDVPVGYVPTMRVQRDEVPDLPGCLVADEEARFELVIRPRGSRDLVPSDLPDADAVFIDGDHSRSGVEHDTALAYAIVRPCGVIIWHDYHDLGTVDVREVLHEQFDAGHRIVHIADTWLAFEVIA